MKRLICPDDLPANQAAVAAALRRAFSTPSDARSCEFQTLLDQLA